MCKVPGVRKREVQSTHRTKGSQVWLEHGAWGLGGKER